MLLNIASVVLVVLILCSIVSVTPGFFNLKMFRALQGTRCTGLSAVQAFIPFYNITFSRKLSYGKSTIFDIGFIVCAVLLLFRVASVVLVSKLPVLVVFSSFAMYACLLIFFVMYIVNAVDFCRMLNCGFLTILCCVVVAPVGYYMLSTQVLAYFKEVEDVVRGTFET